MPSTSSPQKRPLVNRLVTAAAHPLTAVQKLTLLALVDCWNPNKNGTKVWPSVAFIAQQAGYKDRAIRMALHTLRDFGFINIDEVVGATNLYYLNLEVIEKYAGTKCRTYADTPAPNARGGMFLMQEGVHEVPRNPGSRCLLTGKEPVKNSVNLTGSEKSNRQKGEKTGFVTAREACFSALKNLSLEAK
jgi:hypothetical protein